MEIYFFLALFGLILVILACNLARIKPNSAAGFKLPAAYASPEIWKKTNYRGAQIMYVAGPVVTVASLLCYFTGVPPETGGVYLGLGLVAVLVGTLVYLYFYSDRLFRKTLLHSGETKH